MLFSLENKRDISNKYQINLLPVSRINIKQGVFREIISVSSHPTTTRIIKEYTVKPRVTLVFGGKEITPVNRGPR